jgi:hypothetical protein
MGAQSEDGALVYPFQCIYGVFRVWPRHIFVYLCGAKQDVKTRIQKARRAFITLKNIWKPGKLKTEASIKIFNTNVKTILL